MNASTIGNGVLPTSGALPNSLSQNPAENPAGITPVDLASREILEWLGIDKGSRRSGKTDPISNQNGAPKLDAPALSFGPNDLQDMLRAMHSKVFNVQMETGMRNLLIQRTSSEKNSEQQISKIQEWIKKSEEKENMSLAQKILQWFAKIFAVIASVFAVAAAAVATAASGGGASVLLALAVVAAVASIMSLADAISKEAGGPEISIQSLVKAIVVPMLQAFGMEAEEAEKVAKTLAGALAVMLPVLVLLEPQLLGGAVEAVMSLGGVKDDVAAIVGAVFTAITALVGGIALAVMSGGSSAVQAVSTTIKSLNQVIHGISVAVNSAGTIAAGAVGVVKGHLAKEADTLLSDRRELQAYMVRIQALMDEALEEVKKVIEAIERSNERVSAMVGAAAETALQVAGAMGGKRNMA